MRGQPNILPPGSYALPLGGSAGVIRLTDGAHIPADTRNPDWRAYQAWLSAGNIPEATAGSKPTTISVAVFNARFTDVEKAAIAAAITTPAIFVGLVHGLANGTVDLTSPELRTWMDALVQLEAITTDRETEILTP